MMKLKDLVENPSGFDSLKNYIGHIPDEEWRVLITRNRDSDILTNSNWECIIDEFSEESENVEVFSFGHWACGWWECLAVRENTEEYKKALEIHKALEDYPVYDESHFSDREQEEANEIWMNCYNEQERIEYIRENRSQFYFYDFKDLIAVVRGKYFNGYASELIY